ncbi:MAG: hypothetical protein LZF86_110006 [Nitrospira sp.]|nr:MAG: hypothetical protein LZF86_110006 [Nitrospira sp.]
MKISIKRIYEPAAKSDGFRVLVDRLWPRGVAKATAHIDLWLKEIAPSTELRQWFNHDPAKWDEFRRRYQTELKEKTTALATITEQAKTHPVTLLYGAKDEQHNEAVVLMDVLLKRKRRHAVEVVQHLRKRSATVSGKKIVEAVRRDRGRRK